jgi:hypothetical protein
LIIHFCAASAGKNMRPWPLQTSSETSLLSAMPNFGK